MASRHCASSLRGSGLVIRSRVIPDASIDTSRRIYIRSMATAASDAPSISTSSSTYPPPPSSSARTSNGLIIPNDVPSHLLPNNGQVLTTIHSFPSLEPLTYTLYPHTHLAVPLRRDILHKAVIYEGDKTRQGTASTKWRSEIRGSGRKIRPQKGSGKARLGDKKSPMLRGGGVAHGPKPRDFATGLPRKMYDKAWRMALSYRWRRGQLVVVDSLDIPQSALSQTNKESRAYWLKWALDGLGWGRKGEGHSMYIAEETGTHFEKALAQCERYGRLRTAKTVDVKNLLEMKRLVIEKGALLELLRRHQSDLKLPLVRTPEQVAERAAIEASNRLSKAEQARALAEAPEEEEDWLETVGTSAAMAASMRSHLGPENFDLTREEYDALTDEELAELIDESDDERRASDAHEAIDQMEEEPEETHKLSEKELEEVDKEIAESGKEQIRR